MTPIVAIPRPCHEDWNAMTPKAQGRHCASCCKTVVDFTAWSNEDILRYLKKHGSGQVCGRFTKAQARSGMPSLDISATEVVRHLARSRMGWLQKVAAIVVLGLSVTFSGCATQGEPTTNPIKEQRSDSSADDRQQDDSTRTQVLGGIGAVAHATRDSAACRTAGTKQLRSGKRQPAMLKGEARPVEAQPLGVRSEDYIMGAPPDVPDVPDAPDAPNEDSTAR